MRKIAAQLIFTMHKPPIKNGYLVIDNKGFVQQIINTGGTIPEMAGLEFYNGIIVPGFVDVASSVELPESMKYLELSDNIEKRFITHYEFANREAIKQLKKKLRWQFAYGTQVISNSKEPNGLGAFEELKLQKTGNFEKKLQELTLENAEFLGVSDNNGTIEKNKKPGINLISGFDFKNYTLPEQASIKRLL